jgi:uncharacterized glyoxalase superfamily protein PhnB
MANQKKKAVKGKSKAVKKAVKQTAKKTATKSAKQTAKQTAMKAATKPAARRARAGKTTRSAAAQGGSGLRRVAPGFTVNDAEQSVAWYRDVLGFTVKQRWEFEGKFVGAEMASGDVTVNLGQDDWKMGRDRLKGQGVRMYITTGPDIDRLANQIKARGGSLAQEPKDEWGMRTFSIDDPDGYKLTFMTSKRS